MYGWIRPLPPARKGAIFEQVVKDLCEWLCLETGPQGKGYDVLIEESKVEVKGSTLWADDRYRFQQIRPTGYDHVVMIGVSPDNTMHMWVVPHAVIQEHVIGASGQHGGKAQTGTSWLIVDPAAPPAWLKPYGDTVFDAARRLEDL